MSAEGLTQSTMKASYWRLLSVGTQTVAGIITLGILARILTPLQFGIVAAAQLIIGFIEIFSDIGLSAALIQRKDLTRTHIAVGYLMSVILGLSFSLVMWLVAPLFPAILNIDISLNLFRSLAVCFFISSFGSIPQALLIRELNFRQLFIIDLSATLFGNSLFGILFAFLGYGEWALVAGTLASLIIRNLFLVRIGRKYFRFTFKKAEFFELFSFGGQYSILRILNYFCLRADNFLVGRIMGAEMLGFYDKAFQIMTYPGMFIGNILDSVMFPSMARIQDDHVRLQNVYYKSISLVNILLMPLTIFLIFLSPEIVNVLLGGQWGALVYPLQMLLMVLPLRSSIRMGDSLCRAKGALMQNSGIKTVYLLAIIIATYYGSRYGLLGVSIGVSLCVLLQYLMMSGLCERIIQGNLRSLLFTYKEGLFYTAVVSLVLICTLSAARQLIKSDFLIILVEVLLSITLIIGVKFRFPRIAGTDLNWLFINVTHSISNPSIKKWLIRMSV